MPRNPSSAISRFSSPPRNKSRQKKPRPTDWPYSCRLLSGLLIAHSLRTERLSGSRAAALLNRANRRLHPVKRPIPGMVPPAAAARQYAQQRRRPPDHDADLARAADALARSAPTVLGGGHNLRGYIGPMMTIVASFRSATAR